MSIARDLSIGLAAAALLTAVALRALPEPSAPVAAVPAARPPAAAGAAGGPSAAPAPTAQAQPAPAPIRTRNGRAIDLQGQDVAGYIARRAPAARTGDARAAYEVYQASSLCAAAEPAVPEFEMPAERQEAQAERSRMRALCAGVSPAQVQERIAFLARAAQAGSRDARIDFFMEGPQGHAADGEMGADDPLVAEWRRQALGFLQQAGAQCDAFALALLSNAYDLGKLAPRDPALTMAYAIAAAAARRTALSEDALRTRFAGALGPDAFDAARAAGERLAATACPGEA